MFSSDAEDPLLQESDEAFSRELRMLAWVPVMQDAPRADIPWVTGRKVLAAPNNVRLDSDVMLVSHTMAICAEKVKNEHVCEFLGWYESVSPVVLALQLIQFAAMHGQILAVNPIEQPMTVDTISDDVRETVNRIYGMLSPHIASPQFATVKTQLRGQPFVLIGDSFLSCDKVALICEVESASAPTDAAQSEAHTPASASERGKRAGGFRSIYAPLLHALPEELTKHQDLFLQLGVQERFQGRDFVGALNLLANSNRGQTLEPEQLTLASRLAKEAAQYSMSNAEKNALWLPDAKGEMTPVHR